MIFYSPVVVAILDSGKWLRPSPDSNFKVKSVNSVNLSSLMSLESLNCQMVKSSVALNTVLSSFGMATL